MNIFFVYILFSEQKSCRELSRKKGKVSFLSALTCSQPSLLTVWCVSFQNFGLNSLLMEASRFWLAETRVFAAWGNTGAAFRAQGGCQVRDADGGIIGQHLYSAPGTESGVFKYGRWQNPTHLMNFTGGRVGEGVTICLFSCKFPPSQEQKAEKNLSD